MSKSKNSQTQKETPAFDPMATFGKLTEDNLQRVQALYDELASWESRAYDRTKATMSHVSEMANDSLAYASALSAEWRKLTLEATRRGVELFSAR